VRSGSVSRAVRNETSLLDYLNAVVFRRTSAVEILFYSKVGFIDESLQISKATFGLD